LSKERIIKYSKFFLFNSLWWRSWGIGGYNPKPAIV